MNRLIIAGGRDFSDWTLFYGTMNQWFEDHDPDYTHTTILSGMADGADSMGVLFAQDRGIPYDEFPAEWKKYGRRVAGFKRNHEMALSATHLVAFWDGKSTGTKDMIDRAKAVGLKVTVVYYNQPKRTKTLW